MAVFKCKSTAWHTASTSLIVELSCKTNALEEIDCLPFGVDDAEVDFRDFIGNNWAGLSTLGAVCNKASEATLRIRFCFVALGLIRVHIEAQRLF